MNTTTNNYQQLSENNRDTIQALNEDYYSIRKIAKRPHRSLSTLSRELKHGTVRHLNSNYLPCYRYYADAGQDNYLKHHANCHSKGFLQR